MLLRKPEPVARAGRPAPLNLALHLQESSGQVYHGNGHFLADAGASPASLPPRYFGHALSGRGRKTFHRELLTFEIVFSDPFRGSETIGDSRQS